MTVNDAIEALLQLGREQKCLKESQIFEILDPEIDVDTIETVYTAIKNAKIKIVSDNSDNEIEPIPDIDPVADWGGGSQDSTRMYLNEIGQYNLLTPEEELDLAREVSLGRAAQEMLKESGSDIDEAAKQDLKRTIKDAKKAKNRLVEANLRLVVSIAKKYTNCGLPLLDLIQEGNLGLMKAIDKFEPEKGFRLTTYASWWIMQAIIRGIANMGRTIRVPVHANDKINKLLKTKRELQSEGIENPSIRTISNRSGIDENNVSLLLNVCDAPYSIDAPVPDYEDSTFGDFVEDKNAVCPETAIEESDLRNNLLDVMDRILDDREREVLMLRFGMTDGRVKTLDEVGQMFGLTRERIRQIEGKALRRLRKTGLRRYYVDYATVAEDNE